MMGIDGDDEDDDMVGIVVAAISDSGSFEVLLASTSADFSTICSVSITSSIIAMVELTSVIGTMEIESGLVENGLINVESEVDVEDGDAVDFAVTRMTSESPALAIASLFGAEIVFTAFRIEGRGVRVRRVRLVVVDAVDVDVVVLDGAD